MCDVNTRKKLLRQEYLKIRKAIQDKPQKSLEIAKRVIADDWYKDAKTVAIYKSLPSEVDTSYIISCALSSGKRVVLPKVFGSDMRFFEISEKEELIKSSFGVLEPAGEDSRYVPLSRIDLVLVPGLCFDKCKNRLGFGRGYYDRYLRGAGVKTIGLCFCSQLAPDNIIPTDMYDVKMQKIITENEIY